MAKMEGEGIQVKTEKKKKKKKVMAMTSAFLTHSTRHEVEKELKGKVSM